MKYYSKSQYGKQLFKQTWNIQSLEPHPFRFPYTLQMHPGYIQKCFVSIQIEDLSEGSWPLGISSRAQILKQDLFPQDTRDNECTDIYTHTQNQQEVKILPPHSSGYHGKTKEKQVLNVFFCERTRGPIINFLLKEDQYTNPGETHPTDGKGCSSFLAEDAQWKGSSRLGSSPSGHSVTVIPYAAPLHCVLMNLTT